MYYIFTGGRDFEDEDLFSFIYNRLDFDYFSDTILVGDCPTGLDKMVRELYTDNKIVFEADWETHGISAGPIRNREMLTYDDVEDRILIAFPGGAGTANCIKQAKELFIPVMKVL